MIHTSTSGRATLGAAVVLALLPGLPAQRAGSREDGERAFRLLVQRHDKNGDRKITRAEYSRGQTTFDRLDRDRDGTLTAEDFRGPPVRSPLSPLVRSADANRDGAVATTEWEQLAHDADADRDGVVTAAELCDQGVAASAADTAVATLDVDHDGKLQAKELIAAFVATDRDGDGLLLARELAARGTPAGGSARRGQAEVANVGDPAPDFDLPTLRDHQRSIRLSSFQGEKPVALVFGSWT